MDPKASNCDMAQVKEGVEGSAGRKAVEDHPVGEIEIVGQFLEIRQLYSIPGNVECDFRHSVIGGKAPEEPIKPMPAVDAGDAEEVEVVVVVWSLPYRDRVNRETIAYCEMGFFRVAGAGDFVLGDLIGDADNGVGLFS